MSFAVTVRESENKEAFVNGVIIEDMIIPLPKEAKWVVQESNGVWYWYTRKPRPAFYEDSESDQEMCWAFKNKNPIQIVTIEGYQRVLRTEVKGDWKESTQRVISTENMPNSIYM